MSIGDVIGVPGAGSRTYGGDTFKCARCGFSYPQGNVHHCPTTSSLPIMVGTATVEVAEVERLVVELENTKAALAEGMKLLELAVSPSSSAALAEQVGQDIAQFLRENTP